MRIHERRRDAVGVGVSKRRRRAHRSRRSASRRATELCDDGGTGWVEWCGRRMYVVDFTPAGFPIGVFEDEMALDATDDAGTEASAEPF